MTRYFLLTLSLLLLLPLPAVQAAEADTVLADETTLKAVGLSTDGAGLVEFFRVRGQTEVPLEKIEALIKQFDAPNLADREKACAELIGIGAPALPCLRRTAKDRDAADAAALASRCLTALENDPANLTGAAARLLARRRPAGAAETLIAFLPYAENDAVVEEVKATLLTVAYRDNKADPALLKALEDAQPLRRATAIEVLCHAGNAEPRATLRKLLHDPVPIVRFQAGLALTQANDAEAVTAMIGVLADLPLPMAAQVEEYLYTLAGEKGPKPVKGDAAVRAKQRDAWKAWWEANDGSAALEEFRKRTMTDGARAKGLKLIDQLGDPVFERRQNASAEILANGPNMLPLLRLNKRHADREIRRRVLECLDTIQEDKATPLPLTAPRLLAVRKPAGAVEAMLVFLPGLDDMTTLDEIQTALNVLAYHDGKPHPALVKALGDKTAVCRAAAAAALCQSANDEVMPELRKLLKDPELSVRRQAALGLAGLGERAAVPALIALLGELPPDDAEPVEDYLRRLSGDHPPAMPTGEGDLRQKQSETWAAWWKEKGDKVELVSGLTRRDTRFLNYTLVLQQNGNNGTVMELGPDGKTRWQINGLVNPLDARIVGGDRVLIVEYNQRRITERNFKGEILWDKQLNNWVTGAQRLPNGNTFITARNQLVEIDRSGKEVFSYHRQINDIMTAHKLRDGQIVYLTQQGSCVRLGADGKEIKSFQTMPINTYGSEVLPNGNVLVAALYQNKVIEYNPDGKIVLEATVLQPMSASRLPNGRTLVASQQAPPKLLELDRQGKQVAETTLQFYIQQARKR